MATILRIESELTGKVTYRAQVRVKGHAPESQSFSTRKKAESWAKALESAIEDGRHSPQRKSRRTLFIEVVNRYRGSSLKELPAVSAAKREQHLDWWVKRFGGRTLAEITPDLIAEARDALAAEKFTRGKPQEVKGVMVPPAEYARSGATVNRYLATLSALFTVAAKEWRLLDRNPVSDVSKKKAARGPIRFLSDSERDALLKACSESPWPALHTLVLLAISTGARRSELISLKWADVDLKAARATVQETKNANPRVLPLVGKALEALRALKLQNSVRRQYAFAALNGLDEPYVHFDGYWHEALQAAGIEDFRFHDLRHTCASYLAGQRREPPRDRQRVGAPHPADDDAVRARDPDAQGGGDREDGEGARVVEIARPCCDLAASWHACEMCSEVFEIGARGRTRLVHNQLIV